MTWLEANRSLVISDYHAAFQERFRRPDVTAANLHSLRKRKGWKVGRAPGRFKGRHLSYAKAEIEWLRENRALPIADYHRAFQEAFGRHEVTAQKLHSLRKRMGWKTGRTGHFEKGSVSPNKGKRCPEGSGGRHPNARRTQFKKGVRGGIAAELYKPIGSERVHPNGYIERKVNDDLPLQARWRFVHLIEWERVNGPIPDGHCLKCLDGDKANTAPSNWQLIPRGLLPRLNGGRATRGLAFDDAPAELKPTVMAIAKVAHQAGQLKRRRSA